MSKHDDLIRDGFCVIENVFDSSFLDSIQIQSEQLADNQNETDKLRQKYTGSLIGLDIEPSFSHLIAHPKVVDAFRELGYNSIKYMNGYIISKPPKGPPLYWHQDWWGWNDSISYENEPSMWFWCKDMSAHRSWTYSTFRQLNRTIC
jgi:hypothetical protein